MYKPLEPVRKFEPLKPFEPLRPFEPIKPFEPLKPFEPPKSFELAKQLQSSVTSSTNNVDSNANYIAKESTETSMKNGSVTEGELPAGYTPVVALEPYEPILVPSSEQLETYKPSNLSNIPDIIGSNYISNNIDVVRSRESATKVEIEDGKAKNTLKEIISEIDTYAEKDNELKDSEQNQSQKIDYFDANNDKVGTALSVI